MERRGFLGALLGTVAAGISVKSASETPLPPVGAKPSHTIDFTQPQAFKSIHDETMYVISDGRMFVFDADGCHEITDTD